MQEFFLLRTRLSIVLTFIFTANCVASFAALAEERYSITPNIGHSEILVHYEISRNEKFAVTTSTIDSNMKLWDFGNGRVIRSTPGLDTPSAVQFSHDSSFIALATSRGRIQIYRVSDGSVVQTLLGHSDYVWHLDFSADDKKLVSAGYDGSARLWDVYSGKELAKMAMPKTSKNGNNNLQSRFVRDDLIVTETADGIIRGWAISGNRSRIKWEIPAERGRFKLDLSADRTKLITPTDVAVSIWDPETGSLIKKIPADQSSGIKMDSGVRLNEVSVKISPDGRVFCEKSGDIVALYDINSGKKISESVVKTNGLDPLLVTNTSIFLQTNGYLSEFGFDLKGRGVKLATASGRNFPSGRGGHISDPFLQSTVEGLLRTEIGQLDEAKLTKFRETLTDQTEIVVSGGGQVAVSTRKAEGEGAGNKTMTSWSINGDGTSSAISTISIPAAKASRTPEVDPTGSFAIIRGYDTSSSLTIWRFRENKLYDLHFESAVSDYLITPDGESIGVVLRGIVHIVDARTGSIAKKFAVASVGDFGRFAFSRSGGLLAVGGKNNQVWNVATQKLISALQLTQWSPQDLAFSADEKKLVSYAPVFQMWDVATGTLLVSSLNLASGEWLTISPEGFFDSSELGAKAVNIVHGLDVSSIDQVYDALHRPDLVREKLNGDTFGRVRQAASELDFDRVVGSGRAPLLKILGSRSADDASATVDVSLSEQGGGIGRVEWRVNRVTASVDTSIMSEPGSGKTVSIKRILPLTQGQNRIEVIAYNRRGLVSSEPVQLNIAVTPPTGAEIASKPRLYVLAVGVNDYFDSRLRLAFAVPDAQALGQALEKSGSNLYERVDVTMALDGDAVATNLDRLFTELSLKVRAQDVFVFFMSGHGKTVDGRFYFIPQDFRFTAEDSIVKSGIGQDQLQQWLSRIPARKSVLLFDACESGSLTEDQPARRGMEELTAIDRLTHAMGRTVLTATTDDRPAAEGLGGHGVFTYALLQGLGEAQVDADGLIGVAELASYVDRKVPQLSFDAWKLRQIPQMKIVGSNFPIAYQLAGLVDGQATVVPTRSTHVVISPATVRLTASDTGRAVVDLSPGAQVRLIEIAGSWILVAKDGKKLGFVDSKALATLQ